MPFIELSIATTDANDKNGTFDWLPCSVDRDVCCDVDPLDRQQSTVEELSGEKGSRDHEQSCAYLRGRRLRGMQLLGNRFCNLAALVGLALRCAHQCLPR
jgi:hypothetical protein